MILFVMLKKAEWLTYGICSVVDKKRLKTIRTHIKLHNFYFKNRKLIFFFRTKYQFLYRNFKVINF